MDSYKKFYEQISKKITKCPVTGLEGQPEPNNPLVWFVTYKGKRGEPKSSHWSYATGRIVSMSAESTNVL